jgi:hypothetical protein
MSKAARACFAVSGMLASGVVMACAFPSYNLPIPFQLYAMGATGALAVSFVLVGYVVKAGPAEDQHVRRPAFGAGFGGLSAAVRKFLVVLKALSVYGLLLTIATGIFGSQIPIANFSVTFFFIAFVLGLAYLTALVGDIYQLINPWSALCEWIEYRFRRSFDGRYAYPRRLAYYPALALYMGYIWIELFANITPLQLSKLLVAYSAFNLAGAWLFGKSIWFERVEFLSVFFRLIGKMAPVNYVRDPSAAAGVRIETRKPFVGLIREPATEFSLLLFVLFMLSSTAVDGAHKTLPWVRLFWKGIYPSLSAAAGTTNSLAFSVNAYYGWQWLMLFVSPVAYMIVYVAFILAAKVVSGSGRSLRSLILQFAFTLVPIAFVYNMTHYFTLLLGQGYQVIRMLSDPFNHRWNLFGTAALGGTPFIPDATVVWHVQVGLILAGHIVSVYLAHVEALKVFATPRKALASQVPMLVLMMIFTTMGLWILSLPITAGQPATAAVLSTGTQSR